MHNMKNESAVIRRFTRRQLAGAVLGTAAAVSAQTPPATPSMRAVELQAAREQNQRNGEALSAAWAKLEVPLQAEPAFHFTA